MGVSQTTLMRHSFVFVGNDLGRSSLLKKLTVSRYTGYSISEVERLNAVLSPNGTTKECSSLGVTITTTQKHHSNQWYNPSALHKNQDPNKGEGRSRGPAEKY